MGGGKRLFRLFYQTTSLKTLTVLINLDYSKSEKCSGGQLNLSKIRITGLTAPNAVGDKLPMFVTGKTKKPKVLQEGEVLPCRYRNQRKSWMDGVLFEKWDREMDKKFISDGRKVALMIGHCPAFPQNWELKIDQFVFLPIKHKLSQWTRTWLAHWKHSTIRILLRRKKPPKNLIATRNANNSCNLGCSNDKNCCEFFSKGWNIELNPKSHHS